MYVRVLKSHHHFFCGLPYLTTQEEVWLRACNNDVQYTLKAYTLIFTWVRVEFFFFFFPRESGEGKQTRLTDMNNSILVVMLQDWLLMVSLKIAERGFLLKAGWPAGWNLSSSSQDLWNLPSPPSRKNTLQILWGNKAWAEQLNQAGSPHWHFLIF